MPVLIPPVDITNISEVVPEIVPLTIVALDPKVISPDQVLVFLIFLIAPCFAEFTVSPFP